MHVILHACSQLIRVNRTHMYTVMFMWLNYIWIYTHQTFYGHLRVEKAPECLKRNYNHTYQGITDTWLSDREQPSALSEVSSSLRASEELSVSQQGCSEASLITYGVPQTVIAALYYLYVYLLISKVGKFRETLVRIWKPSFLFRVSPYEPFQVRRTSISACCEFLFSYIVFWFRIPLFWFRISLFWFRSPLFWFRIPLFWFRISLFWFRISLFWFRISLFWFRISLFWFRSPLFWFRIPLFWFRISLFWFRISLFWFRISLFWFRISLFWFRSPLFWFRISLFWFRIPLFWFRIPLFWFRIPLFWFRISLFWFRIPLFWFRIPLFWFRISLFRFRSPLFWFRIPLFWFRIPLLWSRIPLFWLRSPVFWFRGPLFYYSDSGSHCSDSGSTLFWFRIPGSWFGGPLYSTILIQEPCVLISELSWSWPPSFECKTDPLDSVSLILSRLTQRATISTVKGLLKKCSEQSKNIRSLLGDRGCLQIWEQQSHSHSTTISKATQTAGKGGARRVGGSQCCWGGLGQLAELSGYGGGQLAERRASGLVLCSISAAVGRATGPFRPFLFCSMAMKVSFRELDRDAPLPASAFPGEDRLCRLPNRSSGSLRPRTFRFDLQRTRDSPDGEKPFLVTATFKCVHLIRTNIIFDIDSPSAFTLK